MVKKSYTEILGEMLKERAGGVSKCLSCRENPRRNENPPQYECKAGKEAGPDVYSCMKHKKGKE